MTTPPQRRFDERGRPGANRLIQQGHAQREQGDLAATVATYLRVLERQPSSGLAHEALGLKSR